MNRGMLRCRKPPTKQTLERRKERAKKKQRYKVKIHKLEEIKVRGIP